MNKTTKFIQTLAVLLFFAISCTGVVEVDSTQLNTDPEIIQSLKIKKSDFDLTADEAVNVALMFSQKTPVTKSTDKIRVDNVFSISSHDNTPLMFAVNYKDGKGFTIVSASKKYYPVLAYVDKGYFGADYEKFGLGFWVEEQKNAISQKIKSNSKDSEIEKLWSIYEEETKKILPGTKSESEAFALRQASVAAWEQAGYTCYALMDCPNELPSSIYSAWCDMAENEANPNYDYLQYSVILEKRIDNAFDVGPLMNSTWDQENGYNASVPHFHNGQRVPVGSIPVAVGQIMRYFENPYGMANLPLNYPNSSIADFLYYIGCRMGINYASGIPETTHIAAINLLENVYLYTTDYGDYSFNTVKQNILSSRPVYMGGFQDFYSHAWVIEGYRQTSFYYEYQLKIISIVEPPLNYQHIAETTTQSLGFTNWFYHNFGYGGWQDGWYIGGTATNLEGTFYPQKIIYNITPYQPSW